MRHTVFDDARLSLDPAIRAYYELGIELGRLERGYSRIEFERTKELLERHLPPSPARVLDVGGGPGAYADWLVDRGYEVVLVDPVPLHRERAANVARGRFEVRDGDARRLGDPDASYDVVLVLGPLYHLVERADRVRALSEARRVARSGGLVAAAAISRFAALLDGLISGHLRDEAMRDVVMRELETGAHLPPPDRPEYFTTAFFHRVDELEAEVADAGLELEAVYGVEGPGWLRKETLDHAAARDDVIRVARALEQERTIIGASAHLLVIAR